MMTIDRVGIKSRTRDPRLNSVIENYRSKINEVIEELNLGVQWKDILSKPSTYPPDPHTLASHSTKAHSELTGVTSDQHHAQLHASAHQADGSDSLSNPLLLGASPVINWQSGLLLLQTDEGTNTNTTINIKGKGTGVGELLLYDEDNSVYLHLFAQANITCVRAVNSLLCLQYTVIRDIKCWSGITSGNPYLYICGYQTGVGVKYGRHWVASDGIYNIQGEDGLKLNWSSYYADNNFLVANNKVADSAKLTADGFYLNSLIANNKVPDSDLVDGEHVVDIVTDARVKAHFPDTIANILSDHTKAVHDALGIDADTLDTLHASSFALTTRKLDDFGTPDDNTDLDASTLRHGLLKKLGGGTVNFLRADGAWAQPSAGGQESALLHICRAYRDVSNQSIPNITITKVLFNAENFDVGTDFDADGVDSNFTVPHTGYYLITFVGKMGVIAGNSQAYIYKNGSSIAEAFCTETGTISIEISSMEYLSANDVIDIRIYHTSGSARNLIYGSDLSWVCITLLGT